MVIFTKCAYDDDNDHYSSEDDPPLVHAEHAPVSYADLEPISVSVVTIDEDPLADDGFSIVSHEDTCPPAPKAGEENLEKSKTLFAGLTGGVVGTLVGGPFVGVIAGGASAYYSRQEGAAGDVSRAIGELGAASCVKARELNEKHNLMHKSRKAACSLVKKAKELNNKHDLLDRSKGAAGDTWAKAKKFNEEHHVMKRITAFVLLWIKELIRIAEQVGGRLQDGEAIKPKVLDGTAEATSFDRACQPAVTLY